MSTRNFIGSGQNSAHPLLDDRGKRVQRLRKVVAYLIRVNTECRMTHLFTNRICTCDERHVMILVSWIETFIFIRGVIIQMMLMK